jgi:hypothetical protein
VSPYQCDCVRFQAAFATSTAAEEQVRVRTAQVKAEREKLQQIFNNRFPGYMSLSRPQPLHAFAAGNVIGTKP